MTLFIIVGLMLLGALMIARPIWFWKIDHVMTVRGGEPTQLYLTLTRLLGVVFLLGPVVVLIIAAVTAVL